MKSHESKPSPKMDAVYAFIKKAPRAPSDIKVAFGLSNHTAGRIISELIACGRIVAIGTATHAGRKDVHRGAIIYAQTGTPLLVPDAKRGPIRRQDREQRKSRSRSGSGVIAGRRYVPSPVSVATMPSTEHQERAALAMLAR